MKIRSLYLTTVAAVVIVLPSCRTDSPTQPGDEPNRGVDIGPGEKGLRLLEPNGGQTYAVGDTMTIRWSVDFDKITHGVQFGFSTSGGMHWAHITVDDQLVGSSSPLYDSIVGEYPYVLPAYLQDDFGNPVGLVGDSCWVKVLAPYDMQEGSHDWIEDISDAPVRITPPDGGQEG